MTVIHDLRMQIVVQETMEDSGVLKEMQPVLVPTTYYCLRMFYNGMVSEEKFLIPSDVYKAACLVCNKWHNSFIDLKKAQIQEEKKLKIIMPAGQA